MDKHFEEPDSERKLMKEEEIVASEESEPQQESEKEQESEEMYETRVEEFPKQDQHD
jgi:hypothetical protein